MEPSVAESCVAESRVYDSELKLCTTTWALSSCPAPQQPKVTQTAGFFLMQMLTVHRASGYIHAQASISNSTPGPGIAMDQPIKGLQTLKVHSQRETVNPAHSQVVLVCHFLHARQRESVSMPRGLPLSTCDLK